MKPNGHDFRRPQVSRRRQFLAANYVFVVNAGEIDRGPHAAVHFVHRVIVILQAADAHLVAARLPF